MIRYRYLMQAIPPAPYIYITLRNAVSGVELQNVAAQLDTAADQTLVPDACVQALGLNPIGTVIIKGVGGNVQPMQSYAVLLRIHHLPMHKLEVVGGLVETHVLLGRDVLNAYRLVLDGPNLSLEIG